VRYASNTKLRTGSFDRRSTQDKIHHLVAQLAKLGLKADLKPLSEAA